MSTMAELKARFAAIPRERFLVPGHREDAERLARVLAIPAELEGYPPDEVRALEQREGVVFPAAFREWMLLFGKSYVELTDWDGFFIAGMSGDTGRDIGSRAFLIEGEAGPRYAWFTVLRGDGGEDSPVYHVATGRDTRMDSPSFTDFLASGIERYEKGSEPASSPVEVLAPPEQFNADSSVKRRPWWWPF